MVAPIKRKKMHSILLTVYLTYLARIGNTLTWLGVHNLCAFLKDPFVFLLEAKHEKEEILVNHLIIYTFAFLANLCPFLVCSL